MIGRNDIKTALHVKSAVSDTMAANIAAWYEMYSGRSPWLCSDINSLHLEPAITREFSNIAISEMAVSISDDSLESALKNALKGLNNGLQIGLATGAVCIKPLPDLSVQYISQMDFIPIRYDSSGRLVDVVFLDAIKDGDTYYTRLERHNLMKDGLRITNKAFRSVSAGNLGTEIPLMVIESWEDIIPDVFYSGVTRPVYGYFKTPIQNTIDSSPAGVSIFASAIDLIKNADTQYSRLLWEYESSERAVHVDETAIKTKRGADGRLLGFSTAHLRDRLYRGLNLMQGDKELFEDYSPEIRDDSYIKGLDEIKREIEFNVGLSYGDISNPENVEKTATEIKSAKKRKYNTINAIQNNLKDCLDDLVYALAFYMAKSTTNYEFVCTFKDSILTDEETERRQDMSDVSMGIMRPEEYRAKWYGETLEEALKNLPQTAEVIE